MDRCADFKALSVKQRRDFIYANRLYKLCFKRNHVSKECKNQRASCRHCKGISNRHHYLLHENKNYLNNISENSNSPVEVIENHNCQDKRPAISLQTVSVIVRNGDNQIEINGLLDSGSNCSFISREIAKTQRLKEFDQ